MIQISLSSIVVIFLIAMIIGMIVGVSMTRPNIH
jgi:hypothetical protein